jgi:hypothetical protein
MMLDSLYRNCMLLREEPCNMDFVSRKHFIHGCGYCDTAGRCSEGGNNEEVAYHLQRQDDFASFKIL